MRVFGAVAALLLAAGIYVCLTFMIEAGFARVEGRGMFRRAN